MTERDDHRRTILEAQRVRQLEADKERADSQRVQAAEAELAAWQKARQDAANWMTVEERAEEKRKQLYVFHKARDSLHIYYTLYPDQRPRPPEPRREHEHGRSDEGRSR